MTLTPTELTRKHVISRYVEPARQRGQATIEVRVGNVQKELGWTNRTPSVFSTLSSKEFQREAGLELVEKKGGPPSGGPSTTVQFVYRLNSSPSTSSLAAPSSTTGNETPHLSSLLDLFGLFREEYAALGGGEKYLAAERNAWSLDPWERLAVENASPNAKGKK